MRARVGVCCGGSGDDDDGEGDGDKGGGDEGGGDVCEGVLVVGRAMGLFGPCCVRGWFGVLRGVSGLVGGGFE